MLNVKCCVILYYNLYITDDPDDFQQLTREDELGIDNYCEEDSLSPCNCECFELKL